MNQCGWCPTLLPDSYEDWYAHFLIVHGVNGYSVKPIAGTDWDISELAPDGTKETPSHD